MGRISDAMVKAGGEDRAALIIYLCAGDPSLEVTPALIRAAAEGGADIVEIGMPFSDPTADGPAIQKASERALKGGATMAGLLKAVAEVRASGCDVPLLLFGYYNPILAMGEETLCERAAEAGIDGLLVVDLPMEEAGPLRGAASAKGLDWVPLVAPTSGTERAEEIATTATGFVYYVSMTGVTGSKATDLQSAASTAASLQNETHKPVAVGFGIREASDAAVVAAKASGVVVGSAVVRTIEREGANAPAAVRDQVAALAVGCKR